MKSYNVVSRKSHANNSQPYYDQITNDLLIICKQFNPEARSIKFLRDKLSRFVIRIRKKKKKKIEKIENCFSN